MTTRPPPHQAGKRTYVDIKQRSAELYVELAQIHAMAREMRWDENNRLLIGGDLKDVDAVCDSIKEGMQALEYIASGSPALTDDRQRSE